MKIGLYKHYKGSYYQVIGICKHSETKEDLVLYEALYEDALSKLWVRPIGMFLEKIEINGILIPRFSYVGDKKSNERL